MKMSKNIYLIGFMGTGKSSVGKILAEKMGAKYIDTDAMVEAKAGMGVHEIFEAYDEPEFRRLESEVLETITDGDNNVVSTGGGIVVTHRNIELMMNTGIVVTLIANADIILDRVSMDETERPLLSADEPLEDIKRLLFERAALYIKSHHVVDTSDITPEEAANEIMELISA